MPNSPRRARTRTVAGAIVEWTLCELLVLALALVCPQACWSWEYDRLQRLAGFVEEDIAACVERGRSVVADVRRLHGDGTGIRLLGPADLGAGAALPALACVSCTMATRLSRSVEHGGYLLCVQGSGDVVQVIPLIPVVGSTLRDLLAEGRIRYAREARS